MVLKQGLAQNRQLVLQHVRVINVLNGGLSGEVTVTISGNRITGISKTARPLPGATVMDAKGKYLIPGLWDMHVHLSYYGAGALPMLVANGITGVRDMGGDLGQIDQWRAAIAAGTLSGPRIKRAGPFIDGPKSMNALRASFTCTPADEAAVRLLVDSLQHAGADFLKVHSRLPHALFLALVDQARKQHIPVAVHLPRDVPPQEAVLTGIRSIEHTESLLGDVIYNEEEAAREQHTAAALKKLYGGYARQLAISMAAKQIFYDPTLISLYRLRGTAYEETLGPRLLPVVTALHQAGVKLLTGSDFAWKEAGIRPGYDLHGELALFCKAGLSPLEALQAATIHPAECLYMTDSVGVVEEGKIADLVILNANPLKDIRHTKNIYAVILNGRYLGRDTLHAMLGKAGGE
ncbi:amidohydrolase family protein [Chitinophaga alhagiae]|uniref:amidohydrolase family protein n=1 Tax=Chitinophaga alhagiae TaxID=2203219 RepID=UPI0013001D5A|nr:amidohydrolase family protein [Chitinophaga alhagiae]